jgi:hypothetical protein
MKNTGENAIQKCSFRAARSFLRFSKKLSTQVDVKHYVVFKNCIFNSFSWGDASGEHYFAKWSHLCPHRVMIVADLSTKTTLFIVL